MSHYLPLICPQLPIVIIHVLVESFIPVPLEMVHIRVLLAIDIRRIALAKVNTGLFCWSSPSLEAKQAKLGTPLHLNLSSLWTLGTVENVTSWMAERRERFEWNPYKFGHTSWTVLTTRRLRSCSNLQSARLFFSLLALFARQIERKGTKEIILLFESKSLHTCDILACDFYPQSVPLQNRTAIFIQSKSNGKNVASWFCFAMKATN